MGDVTAGDVFFAQFNYSWQTRADGNFVDLIDKSSGTCVITDLSEVLAGLQWSGTSAGYSAAVGGTARFGALIVTTSGSLVLRGGTTATLGTPKSSISAWFVKKQ
jgi:hypothetical protein